MRLALLILTAAALLAPSAPGVLGDDCTMQEVVVYVHDGADVGAVKTRCTSELGVLAPKIERELSGDEDVVRGRVLVYEVPRCTDRWARRTATRLLGACGVRDSFVNGRARVRGAPTQIPVIEGDLEPRSVIDQPALGQVSMAGAAAIGTGAGIVVAVLDGGFDLRHEMLQGRIDAAAWDAITGDDDPQDAGNGSDDDDDGVTDALVGHGTFVSSLILASAPDATILPVRVLDDEGWGTPVALALGVQHAIEHGADVINLSLTVSSGSPMVRDAIRAALDAGITIVASSGNGPGWQQDPRVAGRVITVGAVDAGDAVASFSSSQGTVHLYSPGVDIHGAIGGTDPDAYAIWSGTSFSAAIVSGAAAIVREVAPSLEPRDVRDAFQDTAATVTGGASGRGRLDAAAAVSSVQ